MVPGHIMQATGTACDYRYCYWYRCYNYNCNYCSNNNNDHYLCHW